MTITLAINEAETMTTKTTPFDAAEHFRSPEDQTDLLNDALASGNATYILNALGTIARARGMGKVAQGAGVTREALYKALSNKGDPKLSTVLGVLGTLNLQLSATAPTGKVRRTPRTSSKVKILKTSARKTARARAAA